MNGNIKEMKDSLRKKILSERSAITDPERTAYQESIISRFLSLASYRFADTVLLYYPIKDEIDMLSVAASAIKAGKKVAFPRCDSENFTMTYHIVSSLDDLTGGTYGIPEPSPSLPIYTPSPEKNDLIVVPAVCFDKQGYRIGYGRGYYDRYLCSFGGTAVGVTFHKLLQSALPRGRFDRRVDILLTEKGAFATK